MKRLSLVILALSVLHLSCGSPSQKDNTITTKQAAPSPSASPLSTTTTCHTEQKLNTVAGELKINELPVTESGSSKHFYEITLNGKSLNKEPSYCTLFDKRFGDLGGKDVVLVSQSVMKESLLDSKNNPIGPDTKYKLITLGPGGLSWLSKTFGNGAPYLEATVEGQKLVIKFQDAFLPGSDHYGVASEETWVFQNGKVTRLPKKQQ